MVLVLRSVVQSFWDLKEVQRLPMMVSAALNDVKSCKLLLKPLKPSYHFTDVPNPAKTHTHTMGVGFCWVGYGYDSWYPWVTQAIHYVLPPYTVQIT